MPFLIMILLAEKFELIHLSILIPITDFLLEFVIVVFLSLFVFLGVRPVLNILSMTPH